MNVAMSWGVTLIAAAGLIIAPVLRARYPKAWWYCVSFPVLWCRIRWTWRRLAWECELTTTRRRRYAVLGGTLVPGRDLAAVVPRLSVGLPGPFMVTARVRMEPGQTPDVFVDAADAMAHAWRVHSVRVSSPKRGEVELTVSATDPLAKVTAPSVPRGRMWPWLHRPARRSPVLEAADNGWLLRIPVGLREDGEPWVIDLRAVPHWLVTGATQSGKSTLVNAIVTELAPRPVALVGLDLKGGMELSAYGRRLSALATDRASAVRVLAGLVDLTLERMVICRIAHVRSIWELPDEVRPAPVVVLVDEIAELFLVADPREKPHAQACSTNLVRLAQLGAALGVHLIVAGQRVGSDLGPGVTALRAQLGGRICHRVTDPETAKMTLGDLFPDAVIAAQGIGPLERGVAITAIENGTWLRARSANIGWEQASRVTADFAHCRIGLPGLTLDDVGEGEFA